MPLIALYDTCIRYMYMCMYRDRQKVKVPYHKTLTLTTGSHALFEATTQGWVVEAELLIDVCPNCVVDTSYERFRTCLPFAAGCAEGI